MDLMRSRSSSDLVDFEAVGDGGFGVGGADQGPACGEDDAGAVGGDDVVFFLEKWLSRRVYEGEFH